MRGVVVNHIDHHLQSQAVGRFDQAGKIRPRAIFWVDAPVVLDGIRAAQIALLVQLPNGMKGHEPDHVHPHRTNARQVGFNLSEGSVGSVIAHIDFVDHQVAIGKRGIFCHRGVLSG